MEWSRRAPGPLASDAEMGLPLHGHQEGRFFHRYYDNHCYLPSYVLRPRLGVAKLCGSSIDASAGAVDEIAVFK